MKQFLYILRLIFGGIGFFLLFVLDFLCIFSALFLFSAGLVIFPASILGMLDILVITTDFGLPVLMAGGFGAVLLGAGLALSAVFLSRFSVNRLKYFRKGTHWKKRRLYNE